MIRFIRAIFVVLMILAALAGLARTARAAGVVGNGTPGSCTEAALTAALTGGGTVTFNCGGPKTITLTSAKTIAQDTIIMGGDVITLTGNFSTRLFSVNSGATLRLQDIVLDKASVSGSDGGAISNHGTLVLENTTIQTSFTDVNHSGGAIFTDGPATIANSTFKDNVGGSAGAIFANFGNANVTISNSVFNNNQAQNGISGFGGAIWVGNDARVTVRDSQFFGNIAHFGGALYTSPNAQLILDGTQTSSIYSSQLSLTNNRATEDGGGIYNTGNLSVEGAVLSVNRSPTQTVLFGYGGGIYSNGVLTVTRSVLSANEGRFGGGVFVGNSSNALAVIDRSVFLSNISGNRGGGLYANTGAIITVTNSAFNGNTTVGIGGGLARFNAALSIFDSSFTYNTAASGGGLTLDAGPSPSSGPYVRVRSITVSGNTATSNQGGGVYNSGLVELYFTTIVSNTQGVFSALSGNTRFRSSVLHNPGSLNCDGDGSAQISNDAANHVTDNSCGPQFTVVGGNPMLGPLQNDGDGTTSYHMPLAGSPLINTGYSNCPPRDQRGALRPDACDIGAVEFGGLASPIYLPLMLK
jgi:predicted outer membrane repeat protein